MIEQAFSPISLEALNAKAAMLTRRDNKYVVPLEAFEKLSPSFAAEFDILDIDGKRSFGYRTQYYDTPDFGSFRDHVQGRRIRSKIRTRHYLDADLCFLEVKLKTARKVTVKKRQAHDLAGFEELAEPAMRFVDDAHLGQYRRAGPQEILPVMQMQYQRMTLVARNGGERLTIDRGLQFWNDDRSDEIAKTMMIIETKSAFGRGRADTILRRAGFHPIGSCSKYCIGLAALGQVPRVNKFLPAINRLLPHHAKEGARVAAGPGAYQGWGNAGPHPLPNLA